MSSASSNTDLLTITGLYAVGPGLPQTPPAYSDTITIPFSGNNSGSLIGYQSSQGVGDVAELWQGTTVTQLTGSTGYPYSLAEAVNDHNQIVGFLFSAFSQTDVEQAFLWQSGTFTLIGPSTGRTEAQGINNQGEVVGWTGSVGGPYSAFQWQNGVFTLLPTLPGATASGSGVLSSAIGINNNGEIVGQSATAQGAEHAVSWLNGVITDLGTLPGNSSSIATAINSSGQIVGNSGTSAFLWQNGTIAALPSLSGFTNVAATSVNDSGLIVGEASNPNSARDIPHAVLWDNGQAIDLNSLLPANSPWVLESALTITNGDQVYGVATYEGQSTPYILSLGSQALGLTAQAAISSFQAGRTLSPAEIIDSAANIQSHLDDLASLASLHLLNVIFLTDANAPELTVTGQQMTDDTAVLQAISGKFSIDVTSPTTVGALPLSMISHIASAAIADTAANVSGSFDLIETIASSSALTSISLTDTGIPTLSLSETQMLTDAPALALITGNYDLDISVTGNSGSVSGVAGHGVTASFAGNSSQFTVSVQDGSTIEVASAADSHFLTEVNAIKFNDLTEIVAASPGTTTVTTGNITELYGAVFGREPDVAGLAYYQNLLKTTPSLPLISFAQSFLASPEYTNNAAHGYAQTSAGDAQFISDTYQNLLHRAPASGDVAWYQANVIAPSLANITPGTAAYAAAELQAHAQLLVDFSASPEFLADVQITAAHPADAQHWLLLV